MKDYGFRAALVNWNDALSTNASLGVEQAVIYSSSDSAAGEEFGNSALANKLRIWTENHPLVLSVLESKGLEFDDVIIVFDKKESTFWNTSSQSVDCLRNLRELYVAVTRAKKKVIILAKGTMMYNFFGEKLTCDLEMTEASIAIGEMSSATSLETWHARGMDFFQLERYELAKVRLVVKSP